MMRRIVVLMKEARGSMARPNTVVEALSEAPVEARALEGHQLKPAWVGDDVGDIVGCELVE